MHVHENVRILLGKTLDGVQTKINNNNLATGMLNKNYKLNYMLAGAM